MILDNVPIIIPFIPNQLGRILFPVQVQTGNGIAHKKVIFKLDTGSDFTLLSRTSLKDLDYDEAMLKACPIFEGNPSTANSKRSGKLQYISNISVKFFDREIQGCTIYFSLVDDYKNLFGADILKYFNKNIDEDNGIFTLTKKIKPPLLLEDEIPLQVYSLENIDKF